MIRTTSLVLLMVAPLAAVAVFRSGAGAQDEPRAEQRVGGQQRDQADMMMNCPMMAGLKGINLFADSPTFLLAQAKDLKLSEQQVEQLEQIQQTARRQARELLTDQQREQLPATAKPLSMMEICMTRMPKTGQPPEQMCPMCMKMMQAKKAQRPDEDEPRRQ